MKMSAKDKLHQLALKRPVTLPDELNSINDAIVGEIQNKALAGFLGCGFSINLPSHLSDYFPHIVGDLRAGGLQVDVVGISPEKNNTVAYLTVTW